MNRRKFIASGVLAAGVLSVFPSYALANNNALTLSSLGEGFKFLSDKTISTSVVNLSSGIQSTYKNLIGSVTKSGYIFEQNSIVKLNESCYAVPLSKEPLIGKATKEMAILTENDSDFYILNEKQTAEFNQLIYNFNDNMSYHDLDIDASDFAFPVEVVKQVKGKENRLVYKNKFGNTITLQNNKSKSRAIVA